MSGSGTPRSANALATTALPALVASGLAGDLPVLAGRRQSVPLDEPLRPVRDEFAASGETLIEEVCVDAEAFASD